VAAGIKVAVGGQRRRLTEKLPARRVPPQLASVFELKELITDEEVSDCSLIVGQCVSMRCGGTNKPSATVRRRSEERERQMVQVCGKCERPTGMVESGLLF